MEEATSERIISDPIYGRVKLPSVCVEIMDTMHFQRLRFVKCLGITDFVYPSGVHSRFTHSIGVAYLAGKCVKRLKKKQPELGITAQDVLAVQIAGLCHDLGHAPFSHTFESDFLPAAAGEDKQWTVWHEDNSVRVFLHMLHNEPSIYKTVLSILDNTDITFICEAIKPDLNASIGSWSYKGRSKEKAFLYEIIANKNTGIDVDRFDYIRRDAYYIGIPVNFDLNRLLDNMMVAEFDGQKRIVFLEKVKLDVQALFYTRKELHSRVYQHKTVKLIHEMLVEALLLADPFVEIPFGDAGRTATLSESAYNVEPFLSSTDRIFENILYSTKESLRPARRLLQRIVTRNLFRIVCSMKLTSEEMANLSQLSNAEERDACLLKRLIIECVRSESMSPPESLNDDMVLTVARVQFKEEINENGIVTVPFYNPKIRKLTSEVECQIQVLAPDKSAMVVHVYSKSNEQSCRECIAYSCRKWCQKFKLSQNVEMYS